LIEEGGGQRKANFFSPDDVVNFPLLSKIALGLRRLSGWG